MKTVFDPAGWHRQARHLASPNYNARPCATGVDMIVLHAISLPPGCFGQGYVERFFLNDLPVKTHPYFEQIEALRVSAHFFIDRQGALTQFVSVDMRAWHAGNSLWMGRENCNDFSVGIEMEGTEHDPFTDKQYPACARLCRELKLRFSAITNDRIVGHEDIAPGRKWDPGPCFDWNTFRRYLTDA